MGKSYASTPQVRKALGSRMVNSQKLSFHAHFSNTVKLIPYIYSFNLTVRLWKMYRFIPLNLIFIPMHHINRTNFWSWNNYFWKVPISHIIQNNWKHKLYYELFRFIVTLKHIQLNKFWFLNWLRTPNAYRLEAQKVFLFQMLGETSIFTLPDKVLLWQKCQNYVFCGSMNVNVSPYILKFKLFFKNTCSTTAAWNNVGQLWPESEMIYLPKKFCLIIINTNTTHILDMPCCHRHQQQRYHNENTKICMFMHYIYVC